MLKQLGLATLADVDNGRIAVAFEDGIRQCTDDCRDRPGLRTKRKVVLTVELAPDEEDVGSAGMTVDVKVSVPKRQSREYDLAIDEEGAHFNDLAPENANQRTLDEIAPGPRGLAGGQG